MIHAALFDLDGTLLDSMPYWEHTGNLYLESVGVTPEPDLAQTLFAMTLPQAAEYMRVHYELPLTDEQICKGIDQIIAGFYKNDVLTKAGITDVIEALRNRGVKIGIATVTDRHLVEAALQRLKITHLFDGICTTTEAGHGKDRPDVYVKLAERLGATPQTSLVFEDALHALKTAKRAGFVTVGVFDESSKAVQAELKAEAAHYLTSFTEQKDEVLRWVEN